MRKFNMIKIKQYLLKVSNSLLGFLFGVHFLSKDECKTIVDNIVYPPVVVKPSLTSLSPKLTGHYNTAVGYLNTVSIWVNEASNEVKVDRLSIYILQIPDATDDLWRIALRRNPQLIKHHQNPSPTLLSYLLSLDYSNIRYVTNPPVPMIKTAIKHSVMIISSVNMTDELFEYALETHDTAVCYATTDEQRAMAITHHKTAINYIRSPSKELIDRHKMMWEI